MRGILVVAPVSMVTVGRRGAGGRANNDDHDVRDDFEEVGEVEAWEAINRLADYLSTNERQTLGMYLS